MYLFFAVLYLGAGNELELNTNLLSVVCTLSLTYCTLETTKVARKVKLTVYREAKKLSETRG